MGEENHVKPAVFVKERNNKKLPTARTSDLESLMPWSDGLPECCRIPVKASNVKPEKPKYHSKKGPLHHALLKLRERFRQPDIQRTDV